MREIYFKAKRRDNKQWVQGGYYKHQNRMPCPIGDSLSEKDFTPYIFTSGFADWNMSQPIERFEVEAETVCEYTGYEAENGRIFERHILGFMNYNMAEEYEYTEGVVVLKDGAWKVKLIQEDYSEPIDEIDWVSLKYACRDGQVRVVGNEIDNPERLNLEFWDNNTPALVMKWYKDKQHA